ncbi:MAG: hypothetical protein E6H46_08810 [Betaproteobacteria bacterium]|nr:MAG: hypothetical protein E6H46_08810 [Betaproteobacteria bacterium]
MEMRRDALVRARERCVGGLDQRDVETCIEERDSDALPHRSRSDHRDMAHCTRLADCYAGGRLADLAFGEEGVAQGLGLGRVAQREKVCAGTGNRVGKGHVDRSADRRDDLLGGGLAAALARRLLVALEDLRGGFRWRQRGGASRA